MKEKKRSFRKEIKQADEFETFWFRALTKAAKHKREMALALGVVLVLILVILAVVSYVKKKEQKASTLFAQAQDLLYADSAGGMVPGTEKPPAIDPVAQAEAVGMLEVLVDQYGGTNGGQMSRLLLGRIYYDRGDFDSAAKMYRAFLDGKSDSAALTAMAWEGLGYAQEANGDYSGALESFRKMSETDLAFMKAWAWAGMARCHEQAGEPDKAVEAYRQLLVENPQHSKADEARAKIAEHAGK
jgi:tetratricopeptide (TPR) repeat protein